MKVALAAALALAVAAVTAPALASPPTLDLRLRTSPGPIGLRMRTRTAAPPPVIAQAAPPATTPVMPGRPRRAGPTRALDLGSPDAFVVKRSRRDAVDQIPLADRLILRVDLGLAVDGARFSGLPNLGGHLPSDASANPYQSVRGYGFGEAYLGSRGIGSASLSTYFASQIRIAADPVGTTPILSAYEGTDDFQTRSAWIESDGLFENKYLAPLRVRAGRMFLYGPAIVHMDGLIIAWERGWFEMSTYAGGRVPAFKSLDIRDEFGDDLLDRGDPIAGSEIRADLRRFNVPLVLIASTMRYLGQDHRDLQANWVPRPTIVVRSSSRFHDGRLARQRLVLRARVSEDSTVIVDSQLRTTSDWFWDYASLAVTDADDGNPVTLDAAARRFLDLGPVRPRFQTAVQAGTVIMQNVDLLARGAVALDVERDERLINPHLPDYIEGGAAIEVRLRRAIGLQASFLVRDYSRPFPPEIVDDRDSQSLPLRFQLGEESLVEGGLGIRYSGGARRFSANGEFYARRTRWVPLYHRVNGSEIEFVDIHGGGRFSVEAWVNPRVRLRGEYDLSTLLDTRPEFRGMKMLRLLVEGTY